MLQNHTIVKAGVNAAFEKRMTELLAQSTTGLSSLATKIESKHGVEDYAWLGQNPIVRKWIGDRIADELKSYKYQIPNDHYYSAMNVDEKELIVDEANFDTLRIRANGMAEELEIHNEDLISELILNGDTALAYDGIPFFSGITGNRNFDNLMAGTGVTIDQLKTDIATARSTMLKFVGDKGKKLKIKGDTIICSPDLEQKFLEITGASNLLANNTNKAFNAFAGYKVIADPNLVDTNDWYMVSNQGSLKAFILQNLKKVRLRTDQSSLMINNTLTFLADKYVGAGYSLPFLALKVVNTGA